MSLDATQREPSNDLTPSWSLWIDAATGELHASPNAPTWGWQGGLRVIAAPGQELEYPPVIENRREINGGDAHTPTT